MKPTAIVLPSSPCMSAVSGYADTIVALDFARLPGGGRRLRRNRGARLADRSWRHWTRRGQLIGTVFAVAIAGALLWTRAGGARFRARYCWSSPQSAAWSRSGSR